MGSARTPPPLSKSRNTKQRALFDIIQSKEVETIHGEVSIASPTPVYSPRANSRPPLIHWGFHVLAWTVPLEATPQPPQMKLELRTTSLRDAAAPIPRCLALAGGFDALASNARSPGPGNRRLRNCLAINGMRGYCCADTTQCPI